MSELQAYYARLHNNAFNTTQYLSACINPSIQDSSAQLHVIEKCGIVYHSAQTIDDIDLSCLSNSGEIDLEPEQVFKDVLCARYDSSREKNSENLQRTDDLETLIWIEREKVAFRLIGITGLLIGSRYFI